MHFAHAHFKTLAITTITKVSENGKYLKAGSHVRRNDASISASTRRKKDFLFLALALVLA